MDRDDWGAIVARMGEADDRVRQAMGPERRYRLRFATRLIVLMYCWAVAHDRPLCWACDRAHYGTLFRPRKLPSVSQFCKRVKDDPRVHAILQALHDVTCHGDATATAPAAATAEAMTLATATAAAAAPAVEPAVADLQVSYVDGKLLTVAMHSRDPDATRVRTNAGYVRGYRLHAWVRGPGGKVGVWSVTGAHAGEQTVAEHALCPHLPPLPPDALVLADVRYDSASLYAQVAGCTGGAAALLTPLQGKAQSQKKRRAMGPARRAAVEAWERHAPLARMALRQRVRIEGALGTLTSTAGGLGPLPAWVRRIDRVTRWVGVKIIFYNVRCDLRQQRRAG